MILVLLLIGCGPPILNGKTAAGKGARVVWQPGDPIPGWDETECKVPEGGNVVRLAGWSTEITFHGGFEFDPSDSREGYFWWLGRWAECEHFDCYSSSPAEGDYPYLSILLLGGPYSTSERAQGAYPVLFSTSAVRQAQLQVDSVLGTVDYGISGCGDHCNTPLDSAEICLSSVRPDGVRGRILMTGLPGSPMETVSYDRAIFVVEFDVRFEDHSGYYQAAGSPPPPSAAEIPVRYDYYGISYDEAWPWDEITDDTIRQQVYDRYTPWNLQ